MKQLGAGAGIDEDFDLEEPREIDLNRVTEFLQLIQGNLCAVAGELGYKEKPISPEFLQALLFKTARIVHGVSIQIEEASGKFPPPPPLTRIHSLYDAKEVIDAEKRASSCSILTVATEGAALPPISLYSARDAIAAHKASSEDLFEDMSWCGRFKPQAKLRVLSLLDSSDKGGAAAGSSR